jgi:hypothetical protein
MKQLIHFLQLHLSGKFHQFDHGEQNQEIYNSSHAPDYDLRNVIVPSFLYSTAEDILVSHKDVEYLKNSLPNAENHEIIPNFNHCDVTIGRNARKVLYENILKMMIAAS